MNRLKKEFGNKAKFLLVDVSKAQKQVVKYEIMGVPTVLIFNGEGKVRYRFTGPLRVSDLRAELSKFL